MLFLLSLYQVEQDLYFLRRYHSYSLKFLYFGHYFFFQIVLDLFYLQFIARNFYFFKNLLMWSYNLCCFHYYRHRYLEANNLNLLSKSFHFHDLFSLPLNSIMFNHHFWKILKIFLKFLLLAHFILELLGRRRFYLYYHLLFNFNSYLL